MAEKINLQVDFDEDVGAVDFTKLKRDEDADDDVKDNWDDESEDESAAAPASAEAVVTEAKPKKKSAKQIAAEKEEAKKREQEVIRQQLQNAKPKTAEEIAEEKRRLLKAQEDSDFAMGADAFLDPSERISSGSSGRLDSFEPTSVESFDEFRKLLTDKLTKLDKSEFYPAFLNSLFQDLALNLPAEDVRKFGATLTTLAGEKAKHEKEKTKSKAKSTLKKKAVIAGGKKDDSMAAYDDYDHDPVDDFF